MRALPLLLLLSACPRPECEVCSLDTDPIPDTDTEPLVETGVEPPEAIDLRSLACDTDRYVGFAPGGDCAALLSEAELEAWEVSTPFFDPDDFRDLEFAPLLGELSSYCLFERLDPAAPALPATLAQPDCEVVAPLATVSDVNAAVQEPLRVAFSGAAGMLPGPVRAGELPWIAVIDTAADAAPALTIDPTDPARHGCVMGSVIRDLLCDAPDNCAALVGTWLALDQLPGTGTSAVGGYYGSTLRLAQRIVHAVRDWTLAGRPGPLVLNLSVGWDGRYNEPLGAPGTTRWSVRAVRSALELAACEGALSIAAAGNDGGGPSPGWGPMYPAAWEEVALPARCATAAGTSSYAPIVYAVGGLDSAESLILGSRPGTVPRLVAPAAHLRADVARWADRCDLDGAQGATMTGSSVAAAVTSAAAAKAWQIRPELGAHEVVQLVFDGGSAPSGKAPPGDWKPSFGLLQGLSEVRRVDVCGAAAEACRSSGCRVACESPSPWRASAPYVPDSVQSSLDASALAPGSDETPHEQYPNVFADPARVGPLPSTNPCLECWLQDAVLTLAINPELPTTLRDGRLRFFGTASEPLGSLALDELGLGDLVGGDLVSLRGIRPPAGAERARISWRVRFGDLDRSVSSDVRFEPTTPR